MEADAEALQTALQRVEEARAGGHSTLALSGLGLRDLPDEVRAITGLRELDLSDNELTALPPWIATFPELRVLDVRGNSLVEVPWQLGSLQLSSLELEGNPHLLLPPPETVAEGTAAVLAHLRASAPDGVGVGAGAGSGSSSEVAPVLSGSDPSDDGTQQSLAPTIDPNPDSGLFSSTASRTVAVGGAAVLLLAAVGVAAAVGSGGAPSHPAAQGSPSGPGGSTSSGTLAGLAAAGLAGADGSTSTATSISTSTVAGPSSTVGAPPAVRPPVVTVTATATATATAPAPPIVVTTHLPGTPHPSTTAIHVVVTKTVAPVVTKSKAAPPAVTSSSKSAPPVQAPVGPVAISVPNATGQITGIGGMCIDDYASNTADYSEIDLWDCNGTGAQSFTWVEAGSTLHLMGLCLDVQGSGTANGTTVDIYHCNGTGAQVFIPRSDGSLFNPNSGKCLDDPNSSTNRGTALQIWDCNGGANQRWQLP